MSVPPHDRKAIGVLAAMVLAGIALLGIPWFLTPPAYLDLVLRDSVFGTDLSSRDVVVVEQATGKRMRAGIEKIGGVFVARIGRINSGSSAFTANLAGYEPGTARVEAPALQSVRVPIDLKPTFGRLEIAVVDATQVDQPVAAAVRQDGRMVTQEPQRRLVLDVPAGRHRLVGQASGFCDSEREFDVHRGEVTKGVLPLSPELKSDEIARFVLGWRDEPHDLDTHFRKSDAVGFPSPRHVFFGHKTGTLDNGASFAQLDVDERYPGKYETLTVRNTAPGEFQYFVHAYQGSGTIGDAGAAVKVYLHGCRTRTFAPPANCAFRIWNVVRLRYDGSNVDVADVQTCVPEGTIVVRKNPL